MRIYAHPIIGMAGLLAFSAPAAAQDSEPFEVPGEQQVGTRFLQEPETVEQGRARDMQKRIAHCAYRKNRAEIAKLLAHSNFYQIDYAAIGMDSKKMWEDFGMGQCLGRVMRGDEFKMYMSYNDSTIRNLFAEEAYLRDGNGPLTIAADAPERLSQRYGADKFHPQIAVMSNLADCIVHKDAANAHALLASDPGSDAEKSVVATLSPTIVACMKSKKDEVSVSNSLIRQLVADGLWSRSYYGRAAE